MACFTEHDDCVQVEFTRRQLFDLALDAPGAAGLVRMEAVRRATDLPQLLDLALEWGARMDGAERPGTATPADAAPRSAPASQRPSSGSASDSPKARQCASSARPADSAVCPSKARRDLEAAKSAAEVIAAMGSASVDELAACPYDWRTRGSSPRTVVAP